MDELGRVAGCNPDILIKRRGFRVFYRPFSEFGIDTCEHISVFVGLEFLGVIDRVKPNGAIKFREANPGKV